MAKTNQNLMIALFLIVAGFLVFNVADLILFSVEDLDEAQPTFKLVYSCDGDGACTSGAHSIGDVQMVGDIPVFHKEITSCLIDETFINPSEVSAECWTTTLNFDGTLIDFRNGETKRLNDFLEVTYNADGLIINDPEEGQVYVFDEDPKWSNSFTFRFLRDVVFIEDLKPFLIGELQEDVNLSITVNNTLTPIDGKILARTQSNLFEPIRTETDTPVSYGFGVNDYSVILSNLSLSDSSVTVQTFITVQNKIENTESDVLIPQQRGNVNVQVIPKVAGDEDDPEVGATFDQTGDTTFGGETKTNFILKVILIIISLALVVYFGSKIKKKR